MRKVFILKLIELRVRRTVKRSVQKRNEKEMAQAMIDYQNEIEAQNYLEGALEMEKMLNNLTNQNLDSQLHQDFFQEDNDTNNKNAARKKSKPYSNTKVKGFEFLNKHCV